MLLHAHGHIRLLVYKLSLVRLERRVLNVLDRVEALPVAAGHDVHILFFTLAQADGFQVHVEILAFVERILIRIRTIKD